MLSRLYLSVKNVKYQTNGLKYAKKAFDLNPSYVSTMTLANIASGRYGGIKANLRSDARKHIEKYITDFRQNNSSIKKQAGYIKKLWAAAIIANQLSKYYITKNNALAMEYRADVKKWTAERERISYAARW